MLTAEERQLLQRHVAIDGDGNVVGNNNTVQVTKVDAETYVAEVKDERVTFSIQDLRRIQVEDGQVGVIGDNATIHGGIHFIREVVTSRSVILLALAGIVLLGIIALSNWPGTRAQLQTMGVLATNTPTPTLTPLVLTPDPTPQKPDNAIFYDDFTSERHWTEKIELAGSAQYQDNGYVVTSHSSKRGWMWILPEERFSGDPINKHFGAMLMEVDVLPLTSGKVTGYQTVVGWDGEFFYMFEVKSNGDCQFLKFETGDGGYKSVERSPVFSCPQPKQNEMVTVRLEINSLGLMRAFVGEEYIGERSFLEYSGGLIGLGTYNGGTYSSDIKASVKFDNLVIYPYPRQ